MTKGIAILFVFVTTRRTYSSFLRSMLSHASAATSSKTRTTLKTSSVTLPISFTAAARSHKRTQPREKCAPRASFIGGENISLGDVHHTGLGVNRCSSSRGSFVRISNGEKRTRAKTCEKRRRRVVKCSASLALTDVLFTTGTVMVMPFYALMIAKPNSRVTRNLMESKLLWLILGILYLVAAYLSLNSEDVVRAILNAFTQQQHVGSAGAPGAATSAAAAAAAATEPFISRCLTLFSNFMSTPETACASWLHLISLDVFLARGVFLDAMEWGTPCRHSILLCCMFGPLGVLAHAFTRYAHRTFDSMFA